VQVVFHDSFYASDYASDAAAAPGRLEGIMAALRADGGYPVVPPEPATRDDLLRAHAEAHVASIEAKPALFSMAALSAGAAIRAAELALGGKPAFACARPPGHHANRSSAWGYCAFCNVAVALLKLRAAGAIETAFVLDFDAHTGDGTRNVLCDWTGAQVFNPFAHDAGEYLKVVETRLRESPDVDIVAVSAGFDTYVHDVGHKLATSDFYAIGKLVRQFTARMNHRRRFAVLEGGYYLPDLGTNVLAFCQGFQ
jgi:acetoin utilization deacetylase AcuC-like enzyme